MGRKPSKPNAIPRFRARKRGKVTYYLYDHGIVDGRRKEEPLGTDRSLALLKWAEYEREAGPPPSEAPTLREVGTRYIAAAEAGTLPRKKAPRTIADNRKELAKLLEFFDDPPAPLNAIRPVNVRQYLRWRGQKARVRANREKSLLSAIWNFARDEGYTDLPNPCAGITGFEESGRDVYIEDDQFDEIMKHADVCLRDAIELAYITGQRPADVLSLSEDDIRDDALHVKQAKTREKRRIEMEGELAALVERIRARKASCKAWSSRLIVNEYGRPIGVNAMSRRWAKARLLAGVPGVQFRDLRAKSATDKADDEGDIRKAQKLLGHTSVRTTERYTRKRRGERVTPTRLRKSPQIAEKKNAPEGASVLEAEVGIEPAYADLQSGPESRRIKA